MLCSDGMRGRIGSVIRDRCRRPLNAMMLRLDVPAWWRVDSGYFDTYRLDAVEGFADFFIVPWAILEGYRCGAAWCGVAWCWIQFCVGVYRKVHSSRVIRYLR